MIKTLAALTVLIVAIAAALGIKSIGDRNSAAKIMSVDQVVTSSKETDLDEQDLDDEKMKLIISSPIGGEIVSSKNITLIGSTQGMAEVFVDDKELKADKDGKFSTALVLDEGVNEILVTVNDENGHFAEKNLQVTYEPIE